MPRIRTLKNYEQINERDFEQENENSDLPISRSDTDNSSESDFRPEKGWWSNLSIISGMPEAKIRQSLAYYREIIKLLENELIIRRVSGNREPDFNINGLREVRGCVKQAPARERKRNTPITAFLKRQTRSLKPEVRIMLEEAWITILKEHYNGR